jgi:hypothetical protein
MVYNDYYYDDLACDYCHRYGKYKFTFGHRYWQLCETHFEENKARFTVSKLGVGG